MTLDELVADYAAACPHLSTPGGAHGACYAVSLAFLHEAAAEGIIPAPRCDEAQVLRVWDHHPTPHFVARIGEQTIDFTLRQFDVDAPFPSVATVADHVLTSPMVVTS